MRLFYTVSPLPLKLQNAFVPQYLQPVGAALRKTRFERILGAEGINKLKCCRISLIYKEVGYNIIRKVMKQCQLKK